MRWKERSKRIIKRFAILPVCIDGEYRWLETVYILQYFGNVYHSWRSATIGWYNSRFVTKADYIHMKEEQIQMDKTIDDIMLTIEQYLQQRAPVANVEWHITYEPQDGSYIVEVRKKEEGK